MGSGPVGSGVELLGRLQLGFGAHGLADGQPTRPGARIHQRPHMGCQATPLGRGKGPLNHFAVGRRQGVGGTGEKTSQPI